ncbi:MAG: hypothetical protein EPN43_09135 [Jatrophihabitans sp.]|nr:MAG: hypothetical protein EPN43_09135 [Jatrophihabitans sp.]
MRVGRRGGASLAVVIVLVMLGLGTAACGAGPSGPPTGSQIRTVLARHAEALRAGASARFLADVDTARADARFRSRQAALITNIAGVPLASWTYTLAAPVTDPGVARAAARRYGAPATVVRVTLAFELAGVDTVPDRQDLWWTFVRRDGRVLLAGDDDMAQAGGVSWRDPWDFGPVVVARGVHSLVLGHIENALHLTAFADAVDAALPVVRSVWGADTPYAVAVYAPASQAEFAALTGDAAGADADAEAITAGIDPRTARPYGQRVVLAPAADAALSGTGAEIVAAHEITHLATAAITAPGMARWVVEGVAEYVAELGADEPVSVAAAELRAEVRAGRVPAELPSDAAFAAGAAGQAQAYEQAWLACRMIAAMVGNDGLVRFYRVAGAPDEPAGIAVAHALQQVVHLSPQQFTERWQAYLRSQLT